MTKNTAPKAGVTCKAAILREVVGALRIPQGHRVRARARGRSRTRSLKVARSGHCIGGRSRRRLRPLPLRFINVTNSRVRARGQLGPSVRPTTRRPRREGALPTLARRSSKRPFWSGPRLVFHPSRGRRRRRPLRLRPIDVGRQFLVGPRRPPERQERAANVNPAMTLPELARRISPPSCPASVPSERPKLIAVSAKGHLVQRPRPHAPPPGSLTESDGRPARERVRLVGGRLPQGHVPRAGA